jgi:sugar phosphate isomerase/epimerase
MIHRRRFLASALAAAANLPGATTLKIGHRQANMTKQPTAGVFDLARSIPGLSGVELQVFMKGYNLWDRETAAAYLREAKRCGLAIPSVAGIWPPGRSLIQADGREECLRKSIEVAGAMGAKVILVASFLKNCPSMEDEASYGPVVEVLRKVAPVAAGAGVTLGLENSLSAGDNKKLIDIIGHPAVRVFWDLDNVEFYGHTGQSITGLETLGTARICQVHCKNEDRLLEEPGRVNWAQAFAGLKKIAYNGWYVFETRHSGPEQCVEATKKNIEFLRRCL